MGLAVLSWLAVGGLVLLVEPTTIKDVIIEGFYLPFILLVFLTVFFSATLALNSSRRGLLLAIGISGFLILRLMKLANIVNGLLLFSLIGVIDFYFSSR